MGDGGYISDEELSPEFLEFEKYMSFINFGSTNEAFDITKNTFEISDEELKRIIKKYGGNIKRVGISNMWDGYCPESLLKKEQVRMRLNKDDFYESEATGLQMAVLSGVQAIILNFRGTGDFRSKVSFADEIENGEILSPQNTENPPFNYPTKVFRTSEQIENYIKTIE